MRGNPSCNWILRDFQDISKKSLKIALSISMGVLQICLDAKRKTLMQDVLTLRLFVIPADGFEPSHPRGYWILSPARLPIPPRRRNNIINYNFKTLIMQMEAPTGFEPVIKVLQTSALPLGYGAAQCSI